MWSRSSFGQSTYPYISSSWTGGTQPYISSQASYSWFDPSTVPVGWHHQEPEKFVYDRMGATEGSTPKVSRSSYFPYRRIKNESGLEVHCPVSSIDEITKAMETACPNERIEVNTRVDLVKHLDVDVNEPLPSVVMVGAETPSTPTLKRFLAVLEHKRPDYLNK